MEKYKSCTLNTGYMKFGFLGIFANVLIEILVQGFVFSNALNLEDPA